MKITNELDSRVVRVRECATGKPRFWRFEDTKCIYRAIQKGDGKCQATLEGARGFAS
mgnify:FL=1